MANADRVSSYLAEGRLGDVLALIQVLGYGRLSVPDEQQIHDRIQGRPRSARSWLEVAMKHPEFFRVTKADGEPNPLTAEAGQGNKVEPAASADRAALLVRFLMPRTIDDGPGRPKLRERLDSDTVAKLMDVAIDLHDRQAVRDQRRHAWKLAVFGAVASIFPAAVGGIVAVVAKALMS